MYISNIFKLYFINLTIVTELSVQENHFFQLFIVHSIKKNYFSTDTGLIKKNGTIGRMVTLSTKVICISKSLGLFKINIF